MKAMIAAIFYYEREQEAIFCSEEYSFTECAHIKISNTESD